MTDFKQGSVIQIKKWIASKLGQKTGVEPFFRNLLIESLEHETEKAILVTVKFPHWVLSSCHICGLALTNEVSLACGIGPVCAENMGLSRPSKETALKTLAELEKKTLAIGVIGPVWIPKSQITKIEKNFNQGEEK